MAVDRSSATLEPCWLVWMRVAAREHRGTGELRIGDLVIVEASLLEQRVAGTHRRSVEPPFLAAEDQVAVRNVSDAGRLSSVPVVQTYGDGLRCDQTAELTGTGKFLIPVDRVRVVHRHDPTPHVGGAARIPQLPAADRLAYTVVYIGQIEFDGFRFG